jgi:hypothetical protein
VVRTFRVISHEIVNWRDADSLNVLGLRVEEGARVAVLRCTDVRGRKVTVAGDADQWLALLRTGAAADPDGILLDKAEFPITRIGWPGLL